MFYTVKTPWFLKKLMHPSLIWEKPTEEKILYLTFDDGPHPTATSFVLEQLKQYNAKATFFCIGKNVIEHAEVYRRILDEGHKVGNHTFNHLNGWKTNNRAYIKNIFEAAKYIDSDLFRPPYGRITKFQASLLTNTKLELRDTNDLNSRFKIIMWSVLSGDFDIKIDPQRCLENVILNAKPGNIIVFHDSTKAWDKMSFALPKALEQFSKQGYFFKALND
ncbi:MAG TPA: polysaccharide deacetylase family protein [Chitinophagaceae bacterium]|jgi:peptidoglycan/xylan/chitin deacetylase (PgdA/CDA1 family)